MSEQDVPSFQPPPPPPFPQAEVMTGPEMTTAETLTGIFFEPGRVFESLRARPRFLAAAIIITAITTAFTIAFFMRAGYENVMRNALENNPQAERMTEEQKEQQMRIYLNPFVKAIAYVSPLFGMAFYFAIGAAIYLGAVMLMGKTTTFLRMLAVWTYSSFPPIVLSTLVNFVLLFLKSPDDMQPGRSLAQANLSFLVDPKASPALAALLGAFDIFRFYGMFLAALGLQKVAKLSAGAAWTIVLALWLIGTVFSIAWAAITGTAMG